MANFQSDYKRKCEMYWVDVEKFFAGLSPHLHRQAIAVRQNLSVWHGETRFLRDILSKPSDDFPLLAFHFWLLDDLGCVDNQTCLTLEKHLYLGLFFSFMATYLHKSILDLNSFCDNTFIFLEHTFTQQATFYFSQLFPETSPFWEYYRNFWYDYTEATLWDMNEYGKAVQSFDSNFENLAKYFAPSKISIAAVTISLGKTEIVSPLLKMMDHLNVILKIRQDITTIKRDLFGGRFTYPIIKTMQVAHIPLQLPINSQQVLGAMVLSDAMEQIKKENLSHLTTCRTIAKKLNLPTWQIYFDTVENIIHEMRSMFSLTHQTVSQPPLVHLVPHINTLEKSMQMAEGYLLADCTFQESWEIQRYTILDIPEVIARGFPSGMIIEVLCWHKYDMSTEINQVFDQLHANGFRYFDNYEIYPDADSLSLLLRLYPYSNNKEYHHDILQTPLRWLKANMLSSGQIPVFFDKCVDIPIAETALPWGELSRGLDFNLLLGLIDYDWETYQTFIEKTVILLHYQLLQQGLSKITYYDLCYVLWVAFRLVTKLESKKIDNALLKKLSQIKNILQNKLEEYSQQWHLTPQQSAFLTAICLEHGQESFFNSEWITTLLKNQRYDGSWDNEPFFLSPNRGGLATWYSSRLMTTAFCYHALKTYAKSELS